jgi:hypothetical protein
MSGRPDPGRAVILRICRRSGTSGGARYQPLVWPSGRPRANRDTIICSFLREESRSRRAACPIPSHRSPCCPARAPP